MTVRVLITGAGGFIGRNLSLRLSEIDSISVLKLTRESDQKALRASIAEADFIIHLAGVNRPTDPADFDAGNHQATRELATAIEDSGKAIPIAFASSTKVTENSAYGQSKLAAEQALLEYGTRSGASVYLMRLPNVFGKWARPNYNSAVATFCYNIARGLPIRVDNPSASLTLIYIDDLADAIIDLIARQPSLRGTIEVGPTYSATVGEIAEIIQGFREDRTRGLIGSVGIGLSRALYATYIAGLPTGQFSYEVAGHVDPRGTFVELLKTRTSGQFSYFTAHPGVTRGGHYHHSKVEKFLVLQGQAVFRFRHMVTGEQHEVRTSGDNPTVVETIPGWTHDITNVSGETLICMLWANEIFDRERPDTIAEIL